MKKQILTLGVAASLLLAPAAPTFAQTGSGQCVATAANGAAGLVNALVSLPLNACNISVVNVGNSLNNLRALNNVLNNSPVLSQNDITVTRVVTIEDVLNDNTVDVDALQNFLNQNNIPIDAVVGVGVLSGGQLVIFR